jgi:hypothetical protein
MAEEAGQAKAKLVTIAGRIMSLSKSGQRIQAGTALRDLRL